MRQASRRSWRIGQHHPVNVYYMAYQDTLQASALKLIAKKMQSSLAVEGELPEEGLSAYGDDGKDMMLNLARQIVAGHQDNDDIESAFAKARNVMKDDDQYLVDDEWKIPTPDPYILTAPEPANSTPNSPQPTTPAPATTPLAQTTDEDIAILLTWKELIDQERQTKRNRKTTPRAGASIFDWALGLQEKQD